MRSKYAWNNLRFLHRTATIMFYLCDICCPEYILSDRTDLLVFLALYDIVSKELPATFLRFVEAVLGLLEFDLQEGGYSSISALQQLQVLSLMIRTVGYSCNSLGSFKEPEFDDWDGRLLKPVYCIRAAGGKL